jgi:signal transduction histidine kinase
LHIIIDDNGPGLPPATIEKLFTPFYTTRADGIGLGLAIVKKLIELHGGEVTAENKHDGGARFVIQLPNAVVGENDEI